MKNKPPNKQLGAHLPNPNKRLENPSKADFDNGTNKDDMPSPWEIANRLAEENRAGDPYGSMTRKNKRIYKKKIQFWQSSFTKICEAYVSKTFGRGIPYDSKEGLAIKDDLTNKWRSFMRMETVKNPKIFGYSSEKKEKMLNKFTSFVEQFTTEVKKDTSK